MPPTNHIIYLGHKAIIEMGCTSRDIQSIAIHAHSMEFCSDFECEEPFIVPSHIKTVILHSNNHMSIFKCIRVGHAVNIIISDTTSVDQTSAILNNNSHHTLSFFKKIHYVTEHCYQQEKFVQQAIEDLTNDFLHISIAVNDDLKNKRPLNDYPGKPVQGLFKRAHITNESEHNETNHGPFIANTSIL